MNSHVALQAERTVNTEGELSQVEPFQEELLDESPRCVFYMCVLSCIYAGTGVLVFNLYMYTNAKKQYITHCLPLW